MSQSLYDQFRNRNGTLQTSANAAPQNAMPPQSQSFQSNGFVPGAPGNLVTIGNPMVPANAPASPITPPIPGPLLAQTMPQPSGYMDPALLEKYRNGYRPDRPGILQDVESEARDQATTPDTSGRRNQTTMGMPDHQIGTAEMAIRAGSAMVGNSINGGTGAMAAYGATVGDLKDTNRSNAMEAYKIALEREDMAAAAIAEKQEAQAEMQQENSESVNRMGDLDYRMQGVEDGINFYLDKGEDDVMGRNLPDIISRAGGYFFGGQKEVLRKMAEGLTVDATLERTMLTKGAISDSEMRIFRSDMPERGAQESEWLAWIKRAREQLKVSMERLRTGETVERGGTDWNTNYEENPPLDPVKSVTKKVVELKQEYEDLLDIGE